MTARWTIFCSIIDNFGDIGVCWRLARQLVNEHRLEVELWVDDWPALSGFVSAQCPAFDEAALLSSSHILWADGVCIRQWPRPWKSQFLLDQHIAVSDVIIEAFGCELPDAVKQALVDVSKPLLWLNLEYLSAETWVKDCHGLSSPQNVSRLVKKIFFFPGFEQGTGGLLRETDLINKHAHWQQQADLRQQLIQLAGLKPVACDNPLLVSLFSYHTPALTTWLDALVEQQQPVICFVPVGKSLDGIQSYFSTSQLVAGNVLSRGALTVVVLPFRSQEEYDCLLSLCDFNLVRGEDSFVRAQWAARPMIWHIYPQDDGVHMLKLQAFEQLYLQGLENDVRKAWHAFSNGWNQGEDCRELWHHLRPQLSGLQSHARKWQKKLAVMPDLATNLVNFETLFKLSAHP
ncbi:elongation factor P maturation arginine rhamnosyltransferase EarP [Gammaproteobacteria bacterium LSUCC0112]|nr:elongation factor P maturation arginine rhamnosyltransferase EarP [Gammaproteobacteria bacterium LSUCC0112]